MASILKRLASCAVTVKVSGEDVHLRFPTDDQRFELHRRLRGIESTEGETPSIEELADNVKLWNEVCAEALAYTVLDDEMEADDWSRLLVASTRKAEDHPDFKDLPDLVNAALTLCGFDPTKRDGEANVTDHVREVDDAIGDGPT